MHTATRGTSQGPEIRKWTDQERTALAVPTRAQSKVFHMWVAKEKRYEGGMRYVNVQGDQMRKDIDPREDVETSER
jgi:hypothetical protein